MNALKCRACVFSAILTLFVLTTVAFGQGGNTKGDLSVFFKKYELVNIAATSSESFNGSRKVLRFSANGKLIEIDVTPNDLRGPEFRAEDLGPEGDRQIEAGPVNTYKGVVRGSEDSEVRLSISNSKVEGYFRIGSDQYFIEPASKYSKKAPLGSSVMYKAEDSLNEFTFACEADIPTRVKMGEAMLSGVSERTVESLRRFDIATEADFEWVNMFGSPVAANNEILSILNMVEGTFVAELNLRIRVTYQHTWSTPDPYASASGSSGILTNFRNHWNANYPSALYPRIVAHLFTAKSNSLSQGVAYLGVVCQNGPASYGLSGYVGWAPGKYLVPAHELGHNLGAQHAESAQSCGNTLMNAQLTGATPMSFCAYSQSQINSYLSTSGTCLLPASSKRFDFDGDNRADAAVFRPSEGNWYVRKSGGGYGLMTFGLNGDKPVSADYDGDGRSDAAIFRSGVWWRLKSSTNTVDVINFGLAGDIPVPAQFDSDDKADVAVFRPSTGQWFWLLSGNGAFNTMNFGLSGDVPLPGDYDGDGLADVNVFRPSNSTWYRVNSGNGSFLQVAFGLNGDKPLMGDFDGDGKSDIAVFRPTTSEWYLIRSSDQGIRYFSFGLSGDIPSTGDFDGDGTSDISVFRPSNGTWYRLNSGNSQFFAVQYGLPGDIPVQSYYLQ